MEKNMENIQITTFSPPLGFWERDAMMRTVKEVLRQLNLAPTEVMLISAQIQSEDEACLQRVYGLPSIKIDGIDVEQDLMMYEFFGTWKRTYRWRGSAEYAHPSVIAIRGTLIDVLARRRAQRKQRL